MSESGQSVRRPRAWLTTLAVAVCVLNWAAVNTGNIEDWEHLRRHGYFPADEIWDGAWHALVTSVFVHTAFFHVAVNIYWLHLFGSRFEREYGSLKFLAFCVAAAVVSSSFELACSDDTGIGASGVVFALFGYLWPMRHRVPAFEEVISLRLSQSFILFALGCVVVTWLGIFRVGNAAHISGMLFGGAVAGLWGARYRPRLMAAGLIALVILSVIPLVWAPWSVHWLAHAGYRAQVSGDFQRAVKLYSQALDRNPEFAIVWLNRGAAYESLGLNVKAESDYDRAFELDPTLFEETAPPQSDTQETP